MDDELKLGQALGQIQLQISRQHDPDIALTAFYIPLGPSRAQEDGVVRFSVLTSNAGTPSSIQRRREYPLGEYMFGIHIGSTSS